MKGQDPFLKPPDFVAGARERMERWASEAGARVIGAKPLRQSRISDRTLALATLWLVVAGAVFLCAAGIGWLVERHHAATRLVTTGIITEYVARQDSAGHVLYYPHIRFRTHDGSIRQFFVPNGTSSAPFTAGEQVFVVYPAGHPEAAYMGNSMARHPIADPLALTGIILFDLGGICWIAFHLRRRKQSKASAQLTR